jgi:hypothetical protein
MSAVSKTGEMKSLKNRGIIMQRVSNVKAESSKAKEFPLDPFDSCTSASSLRVPKN